MTDEPHVRDLGMVDGPPEQAVGGSFTCRLCGTLPILVAAGRDLPTVMLLHVRDHHPETLCATATDHRPDHGCPYPELCDQCPALGYRHPRLRSHL